MAEDEIGDQITAALEKGIWEMFDVKDVAPFRDAAVEAYRIRTLGKALVHEVQIVNHVFPSDVQQTVTLSLQLVDTDREKASVLIKGALEQVLSRLAIVPQEQWQQKKAWWKFWDR